MVVVNYVDNIVLAGKIYSLLDIGGGLIRRHRAIPI